MFTVMTVGMAGVAGTILAAYAAMGIRIDYLVAAAFMSAPGGVLMAKLIYPDQPPVRPKSPTTPRCTIRTSRSSPTARKNAPPT